MVSLQGFYKDNKVGHEYIGDYYNPSPALWRLVYGFLPVTATVYVHIYGYTRGIFIPRSYF